MVAQLLVVVTPKHDLYVVFPPFWSPFKISAREATGQAQSGSKAQWSPDSCISLESQHGRQVTMRSRQAALVAICNPRVRWCWNTKATNSTDRQKVHQIHNMHRWELTSSMLFDTSLPSRGQMPRRDSWLHNASARAFGTSFYQEVKAASSDNAPLAHASTFPSITCFRSLPSCAGRPAKVQ